MFIGRAQEKVSVFATTRRRDADGHAYPWIVRESRVVTQWYFYCYDCCAGPFFLKYCGYFPYNARLCCNGNEYAKAMAARAGIGGDRIMLFGEVGGLPGPGKAEGDGLDIPDPYGGDSSDFGAVLDLIEAAARHIAAQLTELLAGRAPA